MADTGLKFLYSTLPGRCFLRLLVRPGISAACGRFLDSSLSRRLIPGFVRRNQIDMTDYEAGPFPSFNGFFSRRLASPERRPFQEDPEVLTAPCDGLLTCLTIREDTILPVKQSRFTLPALLQDPALAEEYRDGLCLIYRLCVNHYHRYAFFDSGTLMRRKKIPGKLHTVRPIALEQVPVFTENAREYAVLSTDHFGQVIQMEVGALLVGKIANHPIQPREGRYPFLRGQEKGCFLYGGSTIIVLLKKDKAIPDPALSAASAQGIETPVRMGQAVGRALPGAP